VNASTLATSLISNQGAHDGLAGAPWSGPLEGADAPATAECMSDCVDTMQRVVNVDAFNSCSA